MTQKMKTRQMNLSELWCGDRPVSDKECQEKSCGREFSDDKRENDCGVTKTGDTTSEKRRENKVRTKVNVDKVKPKTSKEKKNEHKTEISVKDCMLQDCK